MLLLGLPVRFRSSAVNPIGVTLPAGEHAPQRRLLQTRRRSPQPARLLRVSLASESVGHLSASRENEHETVKSDSNSFRDFPPDLLAASGIPIIVVALLTSWLLSLRGWQWIAAYCCALLIALIGAVCLFRAKLPLYRQHRFFTFGSRHLPAASIPLYRLGCRLSIIGILLAVLLLLTSFLCRGVSS